MTGLSARRFGLKGRGVIEVGAYADLVLFDPVTVRDVADFDDPVQRSTGIEAVWVNGQLAYRDGEPGARAGRFLPREGDLRHGFVTPGAA